MQPLISQTAERPKVESMSEVGMVWYGMVYVNLYSTIVANVSNALRTLVPGKQPSFQALFEGAKVLLCAEVVRQRVCCRVHISSSDTAAGVEFKICH